MLLIYGRRKARIKKYTDNQQSCKSCGSFDLEVRVYREYFHLFYIPVFPVGSKKVEMRCRTCGEPNRIESLQSHYENITRTPVYLYAAPILLAGVIAIGIIGNLNDQRKKANYVANPQVGDVYRIRKDENNSTTYYFLRLASINGDTVSVYHNTLEYHRFVSKLSDDDFFVKEEELFFLKSELKQMLDRDEINSVERNYGDYQGFNRIK